MAQDIKNEEVKEEEVVETAEETTPEKSELDLANERAEEFENKSCHHWTTLNVPLPSKG